MLTENVPSATALHLPLVSILYLRCGYTNQKGRGVGVPNKVSILYLRCGNKIAELDVCCYDDIVSILYLRC